MVDKYGVGQDPYTYPNSSVLVNKLNIKSQTQLNELENELSTLALHDIDFKPAPYDFSYLCLLHQKLFGDLYIWAGKIRSISISKKDTRFCQPKFIQKETNKLFIQLSNKKYFEELDFDSFCSEMAEFYIEFRIKYDSSFSRRQRKSAASIVLTPCYPL